MKSLRKPAYAIIGLLLTGYLVVALVGPQGFFTLRDKLRDIQQMERDNDALEHLNLDMQKRIEKVKSSRSQREVLVRDKLKYTLPDETQFVLQDDVKPIAPESPAPAH